MKRFRSSYGNVAIEFAIVLPFLLMLVLAGMDFGIVEFNKILLRSAVNAGIEQAIGASSTPAAVTTAVQNATTMQNVTIGVTQFCQCSNNTAIACNSTCTGGGSPDKYIQISASTNVTLSGVYSFVPNPFPISEQAIMMVR